MFSSLTKDNYYTNGIFVEYSMLRKNNSIQSFTFAQLIYTPQVRIIEDLEHMDRPFAGYLYIGYNYKKLISSSSFYVIGGQIGTIGSSSKSADAQNWFHELVGISNPQGWDYQIEAGRVVQLSFDYYKNLFRNPTSSFSYFSETNLGSSFVNSSIGFNQKMSFTPTLPMNKSAAFDNQLNNKDLKTERFIYLKPMITYNVYDATIQGAMTNDNSPITKSLNPIVITAEIVYKVRYKRNSFSYFFTIQTKKTKEMIVKYNQFAGLAYSFIF